MAKPMSNTVYAALRDRGAVDVPAEKVLRCIVDLRPGEPARVLIQQVGDEELLSLGDLLDERPEEG